MTDRLAMYLRHAERFGTELVYECANGLSEADMVRLRVALDAIDRKAKGRRRQSRQRLVGKAEAAREAVLVLAADGMVPIAIANKLGISDRTVRRYLNGQAKAENGSAIPLPMPGSWPKPHDADDGLSA